MNELIPFIGLENGEMKVFVSPFKLNKLGDMHMRGKDFPKCAQSPITNSECLEVLTSMESYYAPIKKKR